MLHIKNQNVCHENVCCRIFENRALQRVRRYHRRRRRRRRRCRVRVGRRRSRRLGRRLGRGRGREHGRGHRRRRVLLLIVLLLISSIARPFSHSLCLPLTKGKYFVVESSTKRNVEAGAPNV